MTIDPLSDVHAMMADIIPAFEAGRKPDIGDIHRFDHADDCGPEVLPGFREPAARVASLPLSHPLTGRGMLLHPICGRLDSRGSHALAAFHLRLHVRQIRRSIEVNRRP